MGATQSDSEYYRNRSSEIQGQINENKAIQAANNEKIERLRTFRNTLLELEEPVGYVRGFWFGDEWYYLTNEEIWRGKHENEFAVKFCDEGTDAIDKYVDEIVKLYDDAGYIIDELEADNREHGTFILSLEKAYNDLCAWWNGLFE